MTISKGIAVACALLAMSPCAKADIIINEVMQSNVYCIMDDINEFPDSWIELYNNGSAPVDLKGYRLGLDKTFDTAWPLASKTIDAGGYMLVYCDKAAIGMHTDFRVDSGKGKVYLFNPDGTVAEELSLKKQPAPDVAYGRVSDSGSKWGYQLVASPGAANEAGVSDVILGEVTFSEPGGVWNKEKSIKVLLSLPDNAPEGSYIMYTTDGSEPTTTNGTRYGTQVMVRTSKVVRAKAFCDGCISIPSNAQSYLFLGRDMKIPVISIAINNEYLYDNKIGIFADGNGGQGNENYRNDWRRPINIEYFTAEGVPSEFNQLCETRVQGGYTRGNALKSMAMYANKRFGTKRFECELWPKDKPGVTDNKSFILRNGGNDFMGCYVRDGLIQRVMGRNTDVEWQGYTPVIVFINGTYHAMLGLRERSNEDNIYANFDGLEDIDMIENWEELKAGDYEAFDEFFEFIESGENHTFDEWQQLINVESYTNLMALNYWIYNTDFPHNNIVMCRKRAGDDIRWRWLLKDCDFGLGLYDGGFANCAKNFTDFLEAPTQEDPTGYTLWREIMKCPEFEDYFVRHLIAYNGDFLNASTFTNYRDEIVAETNGELGISHEEWKYKAWAWWANLQDNLNNMGTWISRRGTNMPNLMKRSFGLSSNVSVVVNRNFTADAAAQLHLTYGGVPLRRGVFFGFDFVDRTIEIEGALEDKIVAWEVKVGSGAAQRIEGSKLTWLIDEKKDITINAIIGEAGVADVAADNQENIMVADGAVICERHISVYDVDGRKVAEGSGLINLPSRGMYIVRDAKGNTRKIVW